jgi:hypothetical protein
MLPWKPKTILITIWQIIVRPISARASQLLHIILMRKEQNISKMKIDQTGKLEEKPFQAVKFKLIFFHKQPPNSMGRRLMFCGIK